MNHRVPDEVVARIREQTDIVALICESVDLKRAGANHKGLCPFHAEKTPSFNVRADRGTYKCFGCDAGGDAFDFVRELQGLTFMDSVRFLGERAGIRVEVAELTDEQEIARREASDHRERVLLANRLATEFYRRALKSPSGRIARDYLKTRGIGEEVSEAFHLGYADGEWDTLVRHLTTQQMPARFVVDAGLARKREKKDGHYDFFRDRLMTPLVDVYSKVVAFGGRTLSDDPEAPKYINSADTPVYRKGKALFGLSQARRSIRSNSRAVVVEGNFDALMLHEVGLTETVASLGTALTPEQVALLHRQVESVYLVYDGDDAGITSAMKAVPLFVDEGLMVRVVSLPDRMDPDDFVRAHGKDALEGLFEKAPSGVEFAIRRTLPNRDAPPEEKERRVAAVGRLVSRVGERLARQEYRRLSADLIGVPESAIARHFRDAGPVSIPRVQGRGTAEWPDGDLFGRELIWLLSEEPSLTERARQADLVGLVQDEELKLALTTWFDLHTRRPDAVSAGALLSALEGDAKAAIADLFARGVPQAEEVALSERFESLLKRFEEARRYRVDPTAWREVGEAWNDGAQEQVRQRLRAIIDKGEKKRQL